MCDLLEETISVSQLQELMESSVPCGGVKSIHLPPCGAEATLQLDRYQRHHCFDRPVEPTDFKCQECYEKWRRPLRIGLAVAGSITCVYCGYSARTIDEFARYVPL